MKRSFFNVPVVLLLIIFSSFFIEILNKLCYIKCESNFSIFLQTEKAGTPVSKPTTPTSSGSTTPGPSSGLKHGECIDVYVCRSYIYLSLSTVQP